MTGVLTECFDVIPPNKVVRGTELGRRILGRTGKKRKKDKERNKIKKERKTERKNSGVEKRKKEKKNEKNNRLFDQFVSLAPPLCCYSSPYYSNEKIEKRS